jgi:hypothetical protein
LPASVTTPHRCHGLVATTVDQTDSPPSVVALLPPAAGSRPSWASTVAR